MQFEETESCREFQRITFEAGAYDHGITDDVLSCFAEDNEHCDQVIIALVQAGHYDWLVDKYGDGQYEISFHNSEEADMYSCPLCETSLCSPRLCQSSA